MGLISWPDSGKLYCDACVIIFTVEEHPTYSPLLDQHLWKEVDAGRVSVITSELSIVETLVIPLKQDNTRLKEVYERFYRQPEIQTQAVSRDVLVEAAYLRAKKGLKTPDAIHLATAELMQCAGFVTNDVRLRDKSSIPILVLDELLATDAKTKQD